MSFYTVIPTLVIRIFTPGVHHPKSNSGYMALTFDDGPDPAFTPQLLDILRDHHVKATFFVLGSQAGRNPELIRRMSAEGHLIAIHNYVHRSNAFMTPWGVRRQIRDSEQIISGITGCSPCYYRPPWGIINIGDLFLMRDRLRLVLWSIIVKDWRIQGGSARIEQRLLSRLKNGAVIVLHDSGRTWGADMEAPRYMLKALQEFLAYSLQQGYSFVRMDEYERIG
jgi:peptidoglycan-N-acetylglucosamine deacetylase